MKHGYADRPLVSGETVTTGRYVCLQCGYKHKVDKGIVNNLPVCPRCQSDTWRIR